ncbi:hypothetical protein RBB50_012155 [Rhinocladiella similis]
MSAAVRIKTTTATAAMGVASYIELLQLRGRGLPVLRQQGKYKEAGEMHRQTLTLKKKVLTEEHPSTLNSMNNLALVLQQQGKYEEAEEIFQ